MLGCISGRNPHCGSRLPARGGTAEGRTLCPQGSVPPAGLQQGLAWAGSSSWGWQHPLLGLGGRGAQPRAQRQDAHHATGEVRRGSSTPEAALLRAGGTLTAHPGPAAVLLCAGTREQSRWDEEVLLPLGAAQGARQALVLCGPQSNGHELQSVRMTRGAAESCPSHAPQGKSPAEAERPQNLCTCTVPREKLSPTTSTSFRPGTATPGPAPLQNICARLRVEGDP